MKFGDYLFEEADRFSTLRLLIEGAVSVYETDAQPLYSLAVHAKEWKAMVAFEAIGTALTDLRDGICDLQEYHMQTAEELGNA